MPFFSMSFLNNNYEKQWLFNLLSTKLFTGALRAPLFDYLIKKSDKSWNCYSSCRFFFIFLRNGVCQLLQNSHCRCRCLLFFFLQNHYRGARKKLFWNKKKSLLFGRIMGPLNGLGPPHCGVWRYGSSATALDCSNHHKSA